ARGPGFQSLALRGETELLAGLDLRHLGSQQGLSALDAGADDLDEHVLIWLDDDHDIFAVGENVPLLVRLELQLERRRRVGGEVCDRHAIEWYQRRADPQPTDQPLEIFLPGVARHAAIGNQRGKAQLNELDRLGGLLQSLGLRKPQLGAGFRWLERQI